MPVVDTEISDYSNSDGEVLNRNSALPTTSYERTPIRLRYKQASDLKHGSQPTLKPVRLSKTRINS